MRGAGKSLLRHAFFFTIDLGTRATTTKLIYDGDALVLEYNGSGAITNRYVHGSNAAADDPLVWYAGTDLSSRRFLHADHLGSIVAITKLQRRQSMPQRL